MLEDQHITIILITALRLLCFLSLSFPLFMQWPEGQRHLERMVFSNEDVQSDERRALRSQGLPSPALCCACGLCIMLAGINITLVGALAFTKLLPLNNPPIIIGPILLLVAFSLFGACCICSRRPIGQSSHTSTDGTVGRGWVELCWRWRPVSPPYRKPQPFSSVQQTLQAPPTAANPPTFPELRPTLQKPRCPLMEII